MLFFLGNLVVVLVALSLSHVSLWWLGVPRGWGSLALAGGVVVGYSLDQFLDARHDDRRRVTTACVAAMAAGATAAGFGLLKAPMHTPLVTGLALLAIFYTRMKKIVPKGLVIALAWTLATVWLPSDQAVPSARAIALASCIFLSVWSNAILCDTLDVDDDRRNRVRALAAALGPVPAARAAAAIALVAAVLSIALGPWPVAAAALPLSIAGLLHTPPRQRATARVAVDLVMAFPGLAVLLAQAATASTPPH